MICNGQRAGDVQRVAKNVKVRPYQKGAVTLVAVITPGYPLPRLIQPILDELANIVVTK
jgi:hypothetical protein